VNNTDLEMQKYKQDTISTGRDCWTLLTPKQGNLFGTTLRSPFNKSVTSCNTRQGPWKFKSLLAEMAEPQI
jgi:hypothetical protein